VSARERLHLTAEYQRFDWRGRFDWTGADFYDLFGPTRVGRKGYAARVGRRASLVFDEPRRLDLDIEGSIAGGLDRLPEFQNVAIDVDRLATAEATLSYEHVRKSLGSVDDEAGVRWTAVARSDYADGRGFVKGHATYDRGVGLPAGHSSIWLRSAAGIAPHDPASPFANFYFGGFGNNYVDHADEKRYRAWYSFPGLDLNELAGRNFAKSTLEWNLPPIRFRRAGVPAFYASWLRPAVFAGVLGADLDGVGGRRVATNAGGQVDVRFGALSALDVTLSVGAAVAFEEGRPSNRELMMSLKILR
jgi:hypothetical protein